MEHDTIKPFVIVPAETAAARWERWCKRLDNFIVAKGITNDLRKKGMLLHYAGEEVFDLSETLGVAANTSFEETKTVLNTYFVPQRNTEYEVFVFRQARQGPEENLDQFHQRLKQLSTNCTFTEADREIKSQIIQKCKMDKVRDKGLREKDITLVNLLQFGRTLEATMLQSKLMASNVATPSHDAAKASVNKVSKSVHNQARGKGHFKPKPKQEDKSEDNCGGCGKGKHKKRQQECPAWGKECFKCKRKNHFGNVCRQRETHFLQNRDQVSQQTSYDVDMFHNSVQNGSSMPYVCELALNEVATKMEIDTGSAVTIISSTQYQVLQSPGHKPVPLEVDNLPQLRTYNGGKIKPLGRIAIKASYRGDLFSMKCLVVPGDGPNLLGRDWLEHIKLDWKQVYTLTNAIEVNDSEFVNSFPELFKPGVGTFKDTQAHLYIDPNCEPVCCKPRVVPFALRAKVEEELARLQAEGVIVPVEFSEWAAPIVPILKKNGEIRICGDYKITVNKAARVDKYPIPNVEDLFSKLSGGSHYSKLDLSHAYQQICLDVESQKLTTVTTSKGLFKYTRLCYGVSSAPGIFQRIMEQLVQGIPRVAVYLDDILVSGTTQREARENLILVLRRLQTAGMRLKLEKCSFLQRSCTYLGHRLDQEGVHPTEDKVLAILKAPIPRDETQLRSFLGLLNYYHKFIKDLSSVLAPLHKLLKSDTKWFWTSSQTAAFNSAKDRLRSSQVLVHFNPQLPLVLSCDASPYGVGAVLSHLMPGGEERPVAFASRTLSKPEKNYAHLERESLSIMFGLNKFHKYLYGRDFEIVTDHKPLLGLLGEERLVSPMASARVQRWALTLANYQYHLRYKPGAKHGNADGLSRLPMEHPEINVPIPEEVVLTMEILDDSPVTADKVAQWTNKDPTLSMVKRYVLQGWPTNPDEGLKAYSHRKTELSIQAGCLMWGARVVVPPQGRETMLSELHFSHPGIVKMKGLARSHVWWPGIDQEIEATVRNCTSCQENSRVPSSASLHPWEWPGKAWHRVHIDYAGPVEGKMILVIIDAHSKYIDAHVMTSATSNATIIKLRQTFATHGLPSSIVSDNGTPFTAKEFCEFCKTNGIKRINSSPYHPASNGLAERAVQTVKRGLKRTPGEDMETRLYRFLLSYRLTPQATTGETPAELLMGRRPRSRLDLILPSVADKVLIQQGKAKDYRGGSERDFHVGDTVYAMNFGGKPKWLQGIIEEKLGPLTVTVRLPDGRLWKRHIDHVRRRTPMEESPETAPGLDDFVPDNSAQMSNAVCPPVSPPPTLVNTDIARTPEVQVEVPKPKPMPVPKPLETTPMLRRSSRVIKVPERFRDP